MSVHFGMNRFGNHRVWTFLPIQPDRKQISMATDRLKHISDYFSCPVGVENLALALSTDDVFRQIDSLEKMIKYSDCYILLDLHNLFCQAQNYSLSFEELVSLYPLDRVLEVHMSGGSDFRATSSGAEFRRDTHDGPLPMDLLSIYKKYAHKFNQLNWIIYEMQPVFRLQSVFTAIKDISRIQKAIQETPMSEFLLNNRDYLIYDRDMAVDFAELYSLLANKNADAVKFQKNYHLDPRAVEVCSLLIEKWKRSSDI